MTKMKMCQPHVQYQSRQKIEQAFLGLRVRATIADTGTVRLFSRIEVAWLFSGALFLKEPEEFVLKRRLRGAVLFLRREASC